MIRTTPRLRVFEVFSDPSHAWLKVDKPFLRRLNGKHWRKCYTMFSHERGNHVFLEEDTDYTTFVTCCRKQGKRIEIKERDQSNRPSRIRNYIPLQPIGD